MKKTLSRAVSALLVALVFAACAVFSLEAEHDCPGENCPVCALLSRCEHLLGQSCLPAPPFSFKADGAMPPLALLLTPVLCALTPVVFHTRMND